LGDLAAHIDAGGEIGVVELGGVNREADEDGGSGELARGDAGGGAGDHIVDRGEGDVGAAGATDDEFSRVDIEA
jgi:hypothetical protein